MIDEDDLALKLSKLDRVDFKIMYTLLLDENLSPLKAVRIDELMNTIDNINISYVSFNRRVVKNLVPLGLVKEGYKFGRSKTYYLTEDGKKYFEDNILSKEKNIFEMVEIYENEEDN